MNQCKRVSNCCINNWCSNDWMMTWITNLKLWRRNHCYSGRNVRILSALKVCNEPRIDGRFSKRLPTRGSYVRYIIRYIWTWTFSCTDIIVIKRKEKPPQGVQGNSFYYKFWITYLLWIWYIMSVNSPIFQHSLD